MTKPTISRTVTDSTTNASKVTITGESGTDLYYSVNDGSWTKIDSGWSNTYTVAGSYTIKAMAFKDSLESEVASISFTVTSQTAEEPATETVEATKPKATVPSGSVAVAKGQKANVSSVLSGSFAKYTTDNSSVATVSKTGVITGKGEGNATITAYTKSGKTYTPAGTVKVYVEVPKLSAMSASYKGQVVTAQLTGYYYTAPDRWVSSKTSVATVDAAGKVTALKAGKSTISAVFGSKKVSATITVKIPKMSVKKASILLGGSVTRKITNVSKDAKITWDYDKSYLYKEDSGTTGAKFTLIRIPSGSIPVTAYVDGKEVGSFNIGMSKAPKLSYPARIKSGKTGTFKVKNIKVNSSKGVVVNWNAGNNMSLVSSSGATAKFRATGSSGTSGSVSVSVPGSDTAEISVYIR